MSSENILERIKHDLNSDYRSQASVRRFWERSYFSGRILMLQLSSKWIDVLRDKPESGMGYQVGKVILKDGRTFGHIVIVEGNITLVNGKKTIPFSEEEIESITLTHEKWDKHGEAP